jgi:DNA-binding Lrp family transcriptional regulator
MWAAMGDELIEKLELFGLTHNQASVYVAVIKSGYSSISQISEATGIHPQDICKITVKLEEKGLVTRTFGKPLEIEALPLQIALKNLISSEKQKTKEKIEHLESSFKDIQKSLSQRQGISKPKRETARLMLLPYQGSVTVNPATVNKIAMAFENIKTQYDLLTTTGTLLDYLDSSQTYFGKMRQRERMKIRILIIHQVEKATNQILPQSKMAEIAEALGRNVPKTADFEARSLRCESTVNFAIIDLEEVWFPIHLGDKQYLLVGSSEELVKLTEQEFERLWNSGETRTLAKLSPSLSKMQKIKKTVDSKPILQI